MNLALSKNFTTGFVEETKQYDAAPNHTDILSAEQLTFHIYRCTLNDRQSQKIIYNSFYGYAMAVCNLYSNNHDDSVEVLNDGFLKIFKEIHRYSPAYSNVVSSFKGWLRKIMIYTAIDHFRKNYKHRMTTELDEGAIPLSTADEDILERISYEQIIRSLQKVTPGYRTVVNLFVIEGFSHEEISKQLGISIGTSKSNLAKGRRQLKKILSEDFPDILSRYRMG